MQVVRLVRFLGVAPHQRSDFLVILIPDWRVVSAVHKGLLFRVRVLTRPPLLFFYSLLLYRCAGGFVCLSTRCCCCCCWWPP